MNVLSKIEEILNQFEKHKLSNIIEDSIMIAFELRDYKNWIMLQHQITNINIDNGFSKEILSKFIKICEEEGVDEKTKEDILVNSIEIFMSSRRTGNLINPLSIYEIENSINSLEELLKLPYNTDSDKIKIISALSNFKNDYLRIRSFIVAALGDLKSQAIKTNILLDNGFIKNDTVFIIHGHNEAKWRELHSILKDDFNLNPIVLSEKPNQGLTIIEKFEKYAQKCAYAFAIFTPDDIVMKKDNSYFQARPNVIFELGWFYAKLGRNRICILSQESAKNNIFSDLQGILRLQFKDSIKEKYSQIKNELDNIESL